MEQWVINTIEYSSNSSIFYHRNLIVIENPRGVKKQKRIHMDVETRRRFFDRGETLYWAF